MKGLAEVVMPTPMINVKLSHRFFDTPYAAFSPNLAKIQPSQSTLASPCGIVVSSNAPGILSGKKFSGSSSSRRSSEIAGVTV